MCRQLCFVAVAVALCLVALPAFAQCPCAYYGQPAYVSAVPAYTAYYPPVATAYYPPAVSYATYYAPVAPRRVVTYYPAPYTTYYAPAPRYYAPVYAPAVVGGRSMFGAPRVYVGGQPVRNAVKAVTP
jgi:hypothetical protein